MLPLLPRLRNLFGPFRRGYWALIPLIATLAYATTLRIGFLSDDFLLLYSARQRGLDPGVWLPDLNWLFYRPVGTFLTWQLGWQLRDFNPFLYHLVGLFMHATVSLLLGLWLATATSNRSVGWLAGALFAVFPPTPTGPFSPPLNQATSQASASIPSTAPRTRRYNG